MIDAVKFSTIELRDWLQQETGPALTPVQAQAQKRLDEVRTALENLTEASKMLVDASQKEIEKRNMKVYNRARALNKLANMFIERIKKLSIPDNISFDNISTFAIEAQKAIIVTEVDIKNWFPHISPFFIMDRRKFQPIFEKTKIAISALNDFVNKEYVKTKNQEKTFHLLSELQILETQLAQIEAQKDNLKNERLSLESEINTVEQQMSGLKGKSIMDKLSQVEAEQDALNNELKTILRHFQKPFIKVQALSAYGGGSGMTPDEMQKMTQYLENPFEAIAGEEKGLPVLKEILHKLNTLIGEGKLKLKPDKQRKAEQSIEEVLKQNTLKDYHNKCVEVAARKKQLSTSPELEEARQYLSQSQQELEKLRARSANLEADEAVKMAAANEVVEKIRVHKNTIEANVLSFLGKQIQIV